LPETPVNGAVEAEGSREGCRDFFLTKSAIECRTYQKNFISELSLNISNCKFTLSANRERPGKRFYGTKEYRDGETDNAIYSKEDLAKVGGCG